MKKKCLIIYVNDLKYNMLLIDNRRFYNKNETE